MGFVQFRAIVVASVHFLLLRRFNLLSAVRKIPRLRDGRIKNRSWHLATGKNGCSDWENISVCCGSRWVWSPMGVGAPRPSTRSSSSSSSGSSRAWDAPRLTAALFSSGWWASVDNLSAYSLASCRSRRCSSTRGQRKNAGRGGR